MKRAIEQMGAAPDRAAPCSSSTRSTASTARAAPGPTPTRSTGTPRSSARTAPRRSPRRPPGAASAATFFAAHPIGGAGASRTDYWLGQQGRITEPMVLRAGGTHYEPISWDDAFALVGRAPARPRQPGRGGLLHLRQDLQRGGVPLPAVRPRLRHQQPARLLEHVPRVHLGGAGRGDRHRQGLGHPAGHPRRRADRDRRPEPGHQPPADAHRAREGQEERRQDLASTRCTRRGWCASRTRRTPRGVVGVGTALADLHLPIRINGDLALFQAIGALLARVGRASTTTSSSSHTTGFEDVGRAPARPRLGRRCCAPTGLTRAQIEEAARMFADSTRTVTAGRWASPSTATRSPPSRRSPTSPSCRATSASRAPGCARSAGTPTCRATAPWASGSGRPTHFLDALRDEFGFEPPREHGYDAVAAVEALPRRQGQGVLRAGRQLRRRPSPTPRSPRRPCATPTSPCRSRPSSTAPTSCTAGRR